MSLTTEQIKARQNGLGGSDAPVVAGLSPYKSPLALYHEKRGEVVPDENELECIEWGNRLEAIVADAYSEKTGRKIRRQPQRAHPDLPWMLGNVDRQIINDQRGPGILELKTTNAFSLKDWEEGPPDPVMLQLQHYLAIYGYQWGSIAVLIGGQHFRYFDIERDDEIIDALISIEVKFWARVQKGDPPPLGPNQDATDLLKHLYPSDSGHSITIQDDKLIAMCEVFEQAKADLKDAESRKLAAESYVKQAMQDAAVCYVPTFGEVQWKSTKPTKDFDEAAFKLAHEELYNSFVITKPGYRRFKVTREKGVIRT